MAREMKDSGIQWLGIIPKNWNYIKGKYIFIQRSENGNNISLELLSPTQRFGVIPQKLYEELTTNTAVKVQEDTNLELFKTIHKGDYCISLRSFQGGFEYSYYEGVVSPAYQVFYPIQNVCREYYKYLFKDQKFIDKMNSYTMSLRDGKNIAFSAFGNTYIPIPPVDEQKKIADYLDKRCAEIDSLIVDIQSQIDILENYKKSIITEAVTKGLNPDVEMKDSGIGWIGKINEKFQMGKLGLFSFVTKLAGFEYTDIMCEVISDEGDIPIVRAQNVRMLKSNFEQIREYIDCNTSYKLSRCALDKKCILITFIGAGIGDVCIFNETERHHLAPNVAKIEIIDTKKVLEEFVMYYISSYAGIGEINKISKTSAQPSLSMETIRGIKIIIPSITEQNEIVKYLDSKCEGIDEVISDKKQQLDVLEEYKKSLIYEYVTGKKEVPDNYE